ncbi:Uncharacterized protein Rs2_19294 [Raphanus sativus]|nr:Uncharacterized protein Rs2_19294 [Raphanus sativus]
MFLTPAARLHNGGRPASTLALPPSLGCGRPAYGDSMAFPSSHIQEEILILYRLTLYAGSGRGDEVGCGFHACQQCGPVKRRSWLAEEPYTSNTVVGGGLLAIEMTEKEFPIWSSGMSETGDRKPTPVV